MVFEFCRCSLFYRSLIKQRGRNLCQVIYRVVLNAVFVYN